MAETSNGQCFCGAIRFRMRGKPMFVHCCHCRDCQQQAGSAFAINALIEAERVELLQGEPKATRMKTDSGRVHDISRCDQCQSPVWSDYGGRPWLRFVRVAALENAGDLVPDVHIYTRSKLPWVVLPEGAAVFAEYYDQRALWPTESQMRLKAAKERVSEYLNIANM